METMTHQMEVRIRKDKVVLIASHTCVAEITMKTMVGLAGQHRWETV